MSIDDQYMFLLSLWREGYIDEAEFDSTYRKLITNYAFAIWPSHPMWRT